MSVISRHMLRTISSSLDLPAGALDAVHFGGDGALPSYYAVTDLAAASVGAAALALRQLIVAQGGKPAPVSVDRRLASLWFGWSIHPVGWERPPLWDAVAGDYATADGWIRLHTNAIHHRDAALAVLGCAVDRDAVARAVAGWRGEELEAAVVGNNGCAAMMRSAAEWQAHPQGVAVAAEPLIAFETRPLETAASVQWVAAPPDRDDASALSAAAQRGQHATATQPGQHAGATQAGQHAADAQRGQHAAAAQCGQHAAAAQRGQRAASGWPGAVGGVSPARPLAGLKVLDLTRVLAGPVATRFLAGYGADVLRIDPPSWNEPGAIPEVTLGKRCARLDLHQPADRAIFEVLLAQADVLVHGYRPAALERLGYGEQFRRALNPSLIDVSLDAYGRNGPLAGRRGFDSLVQMSCGIAEHGMRMQGASKPVPLPVQALDHATGYLMAAAVLRGLLFRVTENRSMQARLSLARTAKLLIDASSGSLGAAPASGSGTGFASSGGPALAPVKEADFSPAVEHTEWGPARRLLPPVTVGGARMAWDRPAASLGSSPPRFGDAV